MRLSRGIVLGIGVFLGVCGSLLASRSGPQRPTLGSLARDAGRSGEPLPHTTFTEQEWIVRDVATAIHQMATAGDHRSSAAVPIGVRIAGGTPPTFFVSLGNASPVTITVRDYLWNPATFAPLAVGLKGFRGCAAMDTSGAIRTLLEPRPDVLVRESERISKRLQSDMRCADAHHEAALLVGSFALREAAGRFSDARRLISRMTAHLAVAEAVEPSSASGVKRLAHALLLTLVGRQRDALAALDSLESMRLDGDVQSWIRALRLRTTGDWRGVTEGSRSTLVERLALLKAIDVALGNAASLERFDALPLPPDVSDWMRLLLQGDPGVEAGNRFSELWVGAELAEFAGVLHALGAAPAPPTTEAILKAMQIDAAAGPVGDDGTVRVLDPGTWAAAAQRHVLMAVVARHRHLVGRLGLQGDARAFRDEASRSFAALPLYPLAATGIAYSRDEVARVLPQAAALARTRPDLVTNHAWRTLQQMARWAVLTPAGDPAGWFRPLVPSGTAYDVDSRLQADDNMPRLTGPELVELRQRAPYSHWLAMEAVRVRGDVSYEAMRDGYGDLASYHLEVARTLANAAWNRPELYVPQMERVVAMNPDRGYWDLAPYLVDRGRLDEGRRAYERWLTVGRSEVTISNSMVWLVRDYHERGERAKATALADRVADVGSFWGLVTRANLHDWRGELDDAERLHRRAWKRYDNPNELLGFYLRHGRTGPEVLELTREVFPQGMARTTAGTAAGAPRDGVSVVTAGVIGVTDGVKARDVIVAVDGIRVRNVAQYRAARGASAAEAMQLTVWRGDRYIDVSTRLRHRWIVSAIDTYAPARQSDQR